MITRDYVTLFLLVLGYLLDSSCHPLSQTGTKAGLVSAWGRTGSQSGRTSLREVTVVQGRWRLRRHGRNRVQRIKRGWVWNQFFVLEEYMGSEPQYVGKVRLLYRISANAYPNHCFLFFDF